MKRRSWLVALAVALVAAVVSAVAATTSYAHRSAKSIEVLSLWSGSEKDAFIKVTTQFKQQTGIDVKYTTARDFVPAIRTRLAAGDPPDVAIIPRPGVLVDFAHQGSTPSSPAWRSASRRPRTRPTAVRSRTPPVSSAGSARSRRPSWPVPRAPACPPPCHRTHGSRRSTTRGPAT